MFNAKDICADCMLDQQEFSKMMHQVVMVTNLFTCHEMLDNASYTQLLRLLEFHHNGRLYLEDTKRKDGATLTKFKNAGLKQLKQLFGCKNNDQQPAVPKDDEFIGYREMCDQEVGKTAREVEVL